MEVEAMRSWQGDEINAQVTYCMADENSSWEIGSQKLERFRNSLEDARVSDEFVGKVESTEVFLSSPCGTAPIEFAVELMVCGSSWTELSDIADRIIEVAGDKIGVRVIEDSPNPLLRDKSSAIEEWYEQEGMRLIPA